MVAELPHPRRVVTGHDNANRAIFIEDSTVKAVPVADTINFAVLYETHEFPADNGEWKDPIKNRTESLANKDGVVLRVVDFKPNCRAVRTKKTQYTSDSLVLMRPCSSFIAQNLSISASLLRAKLSGE
jgi:hypothetical protein